MFVRMVRFIKKMFRKKKLKFILSKNVSKKLIYLKIKFCESSFYRISLKVSLTFWVVD